MTMDCVLLHHLVRVVTFHMHIGKLVLAEGCVLRGL